MRRALLNTLWALVSVCALLSCGPQTLQSTPDGVYVEFPNGTKCFKPNAYDKTNSPEFSAKVKEIVELKVKNDQKLEKLRALSEDGTLIDTQVYRLCEEFGNNIINASEHREQKLLILQWKAASKQTGS